MASISVPVTLVSGFSEVGKTSVVEHLRRSLRARRPAFIYFDGESDLLEQIESAIEMDGADLVVIEAACHLEPFAVVELLEEGEPGRLPPKGLRVDTLVTVLDANRLVEEVLGIQDMRERVANCEPEDERTVAEVLIEQIEFADVLVINKINLVDEGSLLKVEALAGRLNPRARLIRAVDGRVRSEDVIATGLFDIEDTDDGAGWLAELEGFFDEIGEVESVASFTYVERRPFHPLRFNEMLADFQVKGLVRAKGTIWVASRHHEIGIWSYAGGASLLSYGGAWFAATPAREWPRDERERADIMSEWAPPFGDRRQEIAFIGIGLSECEVRERVDECLLTADEMKDGPDSWFSIPDPLPDWHVEANGAND